MHIVAFICSILLYPQRRNMIENHWGGIMSGLSTADRMASPPLISIPRDYNAAYDLLESNRRAGRDSKVAYIDDHGTCTYGELTERVKQFAHALQRLGLEPEHRVLVLLQDSIDFPVAFLRVHLGGRHPRCGRARDWGRTGCPNSTAGRQPRSRPGGLESSCCPIVTDRFSPASRD